MNRSSVPVRRGVLVVLMAVSTLLAACSSTDEASSGSTTTAPVETSGGDGSEARPAGSDGRGLYLSLGDSYATGDGASNPSFAYAEMLPERLQDRGLDLDLVNIACAGATVQSFVDEPACTEGLDDETAEKVGDGSQLEAAVALLEADPGAVELITVSIGGNNVTRCARGADDPIACVADAVTTIGEVLRPALADLREAAGPDTLIVGITYPDVILGAWLEENTRQLAELSVVAFRDLINPMLQESYEGVDAVFVDVTDGTDAYTPLDEMTELPGHGSVPIAVARVCELTWFCERMDIHPNDAGYEVITELIVDAVPRR